MKCQWDGPIWTVYFLVLVIHGVRTVLKFVTLQQNHIIRITLFKVFSFSVIKVFWITWLNNFWFYNIQIQMYKHKIYSLEKTECRALGYLFHIWLLFCCLFCSWFFGCWFHYRHFTTFTFTVVFVGGLVNFFLKGFLSFSQFTLLEEKCQNHNDFSKITLAALRASSLFSSSSFNFCEAKKTESKA